MSTVVEHDVDVLAALDFDVEVPCEIRTCRHGNPPAEWIGTKFCGCRSAVCPGTKENTDDYLARMAGVILQVVCQRCGAKFSGEAEGMLLRWEPLR